MDAILEDEQNASSKKSDECIEDNKSSPAPSVSNDESDFDSIKNNVRNEEQLSNVDSDTKLNFAIDDSSVESKTEQPKSESESESESKTSAKDDTKNVNISFDEDIILPSVRHDTEQIEQKQRDRIKRKEMKSRKELEEEEREKMQ